MRGPLLMLAGAVLLVAVADFALNTWPALREVARLEEQADRALERNEERLARNGAPPRPEELGQLREDLARLGRELDKDRGALFARARTSTDYLFPVAQRPSTGGLAAAHENLELALLPLQLEIREYPALNALDLGIRFPSATTRWEPTPETVRDQAERVVLTQWLLDCLRSAEGVDLRRCILGRVRAGAPLEAELLVAAGIEDLVPFYQRFLSSTPAAPPRALEQVRLRRLSPEDWAPDLARYRSPPVELLLNVRLAAPDAPASETPGWAVEGGP